MRGEHDAENPAQRVIGAERLMFEYVECGGNIAAFQTLEQCSGFEGWIDVCKAWREEEQQ